MITHMIEMTEEDIIYQVEVFLIFYLGRINIYKDGKSDELANLFFNANYKNVLEENLKVFLREPLKDPRFRKKFNEYFKNHKVDAIRNSGFQWLSEILIWEV